MIISESLFEQTEAEKEYGSRNELGRELARLVNSWRISMGSGLGVMRLVIVVLSMVMRS